MNVPSSRGSENQKYNSIAMFLELSGTILKYYYMYLPNTFPTTQDHCTAFTPAAGHDGTPGYVILTLRLLTGLPSATLHPRPSQSQSCAHCMGEDQDGITECEETKGVRTEQTALVALAGCGKAIDCPTREKSTPGVRGPAITATAPI
jgi:hypothetical protein